jgi:hypothetical protein
MRWERAARRPTRSPKPRSHVDDTPTQASRPRGPPPASNFSHVRRSCKRLLFKLLFYTVDYDVCREMFEIKSKIGIG